MAMITSSSRYQPGIVTNSINTWKSDYQAVRIQRMISGRVGRFPYIKMPVR